jgi:hypothetical protein
VQTAGQYFYAESRKIASHPTCPPLSFVSGASSLSLNSKELSKPSKFEVLLSLNSSAEISHQSTHIICCLLSQNRILKFFSSSFLWQKEKLLRFSHSFCKYSPESNICKRLVTYHRLFFLHSTIYTPVCPSYFTCNLLLAVFYLICIILIE